MLSNRNTNVSRVEKNVIFKGSLETPTVCVENATKSYENGNKILNNFNMTVQRGIYGLLGASGCGKTTILSCIVGLNKLDDGTIAVFGKKPKIGNKLIGFMPQEIALYETFTLHEILLYFGLIMHMTRSEIQARTDFLLNFLDLPESNRKIHSLSGGQKRRMSLAIALLSLTNQQNKLLILDEPTVGVDPLVRENIWKYLVTLSSTGTTIILSTHFIEECKTADMVGIMRNGRLLVEQSPQSLLEEYNIQSLERIFLKLCEDDQNGSLRSVAQTEPLQIEYNNRSPTKDINEDDLNKENILGLKFKQRHTSSGDPFSYTPASYSSNTKSGFGRVKEYFSNYYWNVLALVIKNFTILIRTPWIPLVLILIPVFQTVLFNLVIGKDPKFTPIGVVDNEVENSKDLLSFCQRNKGGGCFPNATSCQYLNLFSEEEIVWIPYASESEALQSVQKGRTWGYISIPPNYTQHMIDRSLTGRFMESETINGSTITAHLDNSFNLKSSLIASNMLWRFQEFAKDLISSCSGENPTKAELPLKFNAIYGSLTTGHSAFMQPSNIILIMFLLPMVSSVSFVKDRKAWTLQRSMVAGVKIPHVLTAFMITEGILIAIQLALVFGCLIFVFDYKIEGSMTAVILIGFLTGITGLTCGFLIGNLVDHEVEAVLCIMALWMPNMVSTGSNWPLEGLPAWGKTICYALPISLPMKAFRSIANRGWSITHPQVYPAFISLAGWSLIFILITAIVHKIKFK